MLPNVNQYSSKTYELNIFLNTETRSIRWLGDPAENRVGTQRLVSGRESIGCSVQSVSWAKRRREAAVGILRGPVVALWQRNKMLGLPAWLLTVRLHWNVEESFQLEHVRGCCSSFLQMHSQFPGLHTEKLLTL